jgi:hypothetical protein
MAWITLLRKVDVSPRWADFALGNINLVLNTSAARRLSFVT